MDWHRSRLRYTVIYLFCVLCGFGRVTAGFSEDGSGESIARVCVVVGAPGQIEYGEMFDQWAHDWSLATEGLDALFIGQSSSEPKDEVAGVNDDRGRIKKWIDTVEKIEQPGEYWLILQGHGTFDGMLAKFNLRGADLSSVDLAGWLSGSKHRWVIAVCSSSSAPFLSALSHPDRTVITATKSGSESNFSRFGGFLAQSFKETESDIDHDQCVSVLEAFIWASRKTERYYQESKLLATEHALIDDNGDGKGTSVEFYRGVRPIKRAKQGGVDGERSRKVWLRESQRTELLSIEAKSKIAELELKIEALRSSKGDMQQDAYYVELERLLVELARTLYPANK